MDIIARDIFIFLFGGIVGAIVGWIIGWLLNENKNLKMKMKK